MKAQFDTSSLIFTFPSLLRHLVFTVSSNNDVRIVFVERDVVFPETEVVALPCPVWSCIDRNFEEASIEEGFLGLFFRASNAVDLLVSVDFGAKAEDQERKHLNNKEKK